ncbi:hypothetical protein [Solidesulfovibrio alcoholivorans]|uniref:hypothetical protein n=1 Tax=Solidesulfovibrio alcoholivorans TaxID=81406 RepID=UPI0012EC966D|nr:hypothetical protein [Solidesulfovibrio alcoholivorans]
MPRADEKLINDFYFFWKWEYTKRNERFRDTINLSIEMAEELQQCQGEMVYSAGDFLCNHISLQNGAIHKSSDDILNDTMSGRLAYKYPTPLPSEIKMKYVHENADTLEAIKAMPGMADLTDRKIRKLGYLCLIDFARPFNDIVDDIRKLHNRLEYVESVFDSRIFSNLPMSSIKEEGEFSRLPSVDRDLPRAVGVWLWDYVALKKIRWENKARAWPAFRQKFQNPRQPSRFIEKYNTDSQLGELLERTRQCIEEVKVLPMG